MKFYAEKRQKEKRCTASVGQQEKKMRTDKGDNEKRKRKRSQGAIGKVSARSGMKITNESNKNSPLAQKTTFFVAVITIIAKKNENYLNMFFAKIDV